MGEEIPAWYLMGVYILAVITTFYRPMDNFRSPIPLVRYGAYTAVGMASITIMYLLYRYGIKR
jgi:hypothetical protein